MEVRDIENYQQDIFLIAQYLRGKSTAGARVLCVRISFSPWQPRAAHPTCADMETLTPCSTDHIQIWGSQRFTI